MQVTDTGAEWDEEESLPLSPCMLSEARQAMDIESAAAITAAYFRRLGAAWDKVPQDKVASVHSAREGE